MFRLLGLTATAAAVLLTALPCRAASAEERLGRLRAEGRLTSGEWRALERGDVVTKVIETGDRSEVLSFAAARVKATAAQVAAELRDREGRASEPWTLQSGNVREPASLEDFAPLTLDAGDVRDLARGRANDCDVRLPNEAIVRLRQALDGTPAAARDARASAAFRELLADYAAGYQQRGDPALFQYENNGDPVRVADSTARLLLRSTLLQELAPGLRASAQAARRGEGAAERHLYWTKEKFWLLDVLSLNEVLIDADAGADDGLVVALSKQLYATHYYESSLGLTVFVESRPGDGWLFFLNRTRADIRRSGFSWVERLLVNHLVRRRLDARLKHLRARLERRAA